jgi:hypothetical protein
MGNCIVRGTESLLKEGMMAVIKREFKPSTVAHACNPNYLGG